MSKLVPPISGIACFLWVTVWSWWLSSKSSDPGTDKVASSISLDLEHEAFHFSAEEPFYFLPSDAVAYMSESSIAMLDTLSKYLAANPGKALILTGLYSQKEKNKTEQANLGLARADALKQYLLGENADLAEQVKTSAQAVDNALLLGGKLVGGVNFSFAEKIQETAAAPTAATPKATEPAKPNNVHLVVTFPKGDYELDRAYAAKLDEIKRYLREHPNKVAKLKGYSQASEEKVKAGDLAELRARSVRRYLVDAGVRRKQIVTSGRSETNAHHVEIVIE